MKKQNMGLATEMLRDVHRRKRFWKIAFFVTLAVSIIRNVVGKAGQEGK